MTLSASAPSSGKQILLDSAQEYDIYFLSTQDMLPRDPDWPDWPPLSDDLPDLLEFDTRENTNSTSSSPSSHSPVIPSSQRADRRPILSLDLASFYPTAFPLSPRSPIADFCSPSSNSNSPDPYTPPYLPLEPIAVGSKFRIPGPEMSLNNQAAAIVGSSTPPPQGNTPQWYSLNHSGNREDNVSQDSFYDYSDAAREIINPHSDSPYRPAFHSDPSALLSSIPYMTHEMPIRQDLASFSREAGSGSPFDYIRDASRSNSYSYPLTPVTPSFPPNITGNAQQQQSDSHQSSAVDSKNPTSRGSRASSPIAKSDTVTASAANMSASAPNPGSSSTSNTPLNLGPPAGASTEVQSPGRQKRLREDEDEGSRDLQEPSHSPSAFAVPASSSASVGSDTGATDVLTRRRRKLTSPGITTLPNSKDDIEEKPEIEGPAPRRRGKLPKETTEILRTWLMAHKTHPYPTEEEKRVLCEKTSLNMSQVSNWMINARRRILTPPSKQVFHPTSSSFAGRMVTSTSTAAAQPAASSSSVATRRPQAPPLRSIASSGPQTSSSPWAPPTRRTLELPRASPLRSTALNAPGLNTLTSPPSLGSSSQSQPSQGDIHSHLRQQRTVSVPTYAPLGYSGQDSRLPASDESSGPYHTRTNSSNYPGLSSRHALPHQLPPLPYGSVAQSNPGGPAMTAQDFAAYGYTPAEAAYVANIAAGNSPGSVGSNPGGYFAPSNPSLASSQALYGNETLSYPQQSQPSDNLSPPSQNDQQNAPSEGDTGEHYDY